MDETRKSEARRWYQQAWYDLEACRWNISGGFHATACFLAQQAAEKALNSLLYYLGSRRTALLTHSVLEMLNAAGKRVPALPGLAEQGRTLDLHYIPSRYPNGLPSGFPHQFYGKRTADEALLAAERILAVAAEHYQSRGDDEIVREESSGS